MKERVMALLLACCLLLGACSAQESSQQSQPGEDSPGEQTAIEAQPEKALEEILALQNSDLGLVEPDLEETAELLGLEEEDLEESYAFYKDKDFGAGDVFLLKPAQGEKETVRQALKDWQEERVRSFSSYDIYNSAAISQNALLFEWGNYLVLLMVEDNEAARALVETYLPEALNLDD